MTDISHLPQFDSIAIGSNLIRTQFVVLETGLFGFSGSLSEIYEDIDAAYVDELGKRGIVVQNVTVSPFWNRFVGLDENGDEISELTFAYEILDLKDEEAPQVLQVAGFPWLLIGTAAVIGAAFFGGVKLLDGMTELVKDLNDLSPNAALAIGAAGKAASNVGFALVALALIFFWPK